MSKYISIAALLLGDAFAISSVSIEMDVLDGTSRTNANWKFIVDNYDGDVDAYLEENGGVDADLEKLTGWDILMRERIICWEWPKMFYDCINWGADLERLRQRRGDALLVAVASLPVLEDFQLKMQIQILEKLLAAGFDVNGRDAKGRSALFWSIFQKKPEITRFLVYHGADVNAECTTSTHFLAFGKDRYPLNLAAQYLPEAIDLLLEHGGCLELAFQSFAQREFFGPGQLLEVEKLCELMLQEVALDPFDDPRWNVERREALRNIAMLQRTRLLNDVSSRIAADVFKHSVEERLQHWKDIVQTILTAVDKNTKATYEDKKIECAAILRNSLDALNQVELF